MSNIVAFPKSPDAIKAQALEHLAGEMRIQCAIACTAAQGRPTESDICDVLDRITRIAELTSEYIAILRAYE